LLTYPYDVPSFVSKYPTVMTIISHHDVENYFFFTLSLVVNEYHHLDCTWDNMSSLTKLCVGGLEFNPRTAKFYTALQKVCHRFNNNAGSCVDLVLCRGDEHRKLVARFGVV